MKTATTAGNSPAEPASPPIEPPSEPRSPLASRDWWVRARLIALILVPVAVAVVLGALRVTTSISGAAGHERVRTAAQLVSSLGDLAHELELERDRTAVYIAAGRSEGVTLEAIRDHQETVDQAVAQMRTGAGAAEQALGGTGRQALRHLLTRLSELTALRQTAIQSKLPAQAAMDKYSLLVTDTLALHQELVSVSADRRLTATASALAALARARDEASRQRGFLAAALARRPQPTFEPIELKAFITAEARQQGELAAFGNAATPAQRRLYQETVTGQQIDRAEGLKARVIALGQDGRPLRALDIRAQDGVRWFAAMTETVDRMHTVETRLAEDIIAGSDRLRDADRRAAILNGILVAGLLILIPVITSAVRRYGRVEGG